MFLVDPKVFRFVVKGVKAIFFGVQRGWGLLCRGQVHGPRKERKENNNNNNNKKRSKNNKSQNVVCET
jgi:hypothetical protein